MLNKGSLCVCVVAVVLVYIGMYAALCKEIGNIIAEHALTFHTSSDIMSGHLKF